MRFLYFADTKIPGYTLNFHFTIRWPRGGDHGPGFCGFASHRPPHSKARPPNPPGRAESTKSIKMSKNGCRYPAARAVGHADKCVLVDRCPIYSVNTTLSGVAFECQSYRALRSFEFLLSNRNELPNYDQRRGQTREANWNTEAHNPSLKSICFERRIANETIASAIAAGSAIILANFSFLSALRCLMKESEVNNLHRHRVAR